VHIAKDLDFKKDTSALGFATPDQLLSQSPDPAARALWCTFSLGCTGDQKKTSAVKLSNEALRLAQANNVTFAYPS
jgi:hypothetical protein